MDFLKYFRSSSVPRIPCPEDTKFAKRQFPHSEPWRWLRILDTFWNKWAQSVTPSLQAKLNALVIYHYTFATITSFDLCLCSTLRTTSCLTSLFPLYSWLLRWHETGLMARASGTTTRRSSLCRSVGRNTVISTQKGGNMKGQLSPLIWKVHLGSHCWLLRTEHYLVVCKLPWNPNAHKTSLVLLNAQLGKNTRLALTIWACAWLGGSSSIFKLKQALSTYMPLAGICNYRKCSQRWWPFPQGGVTACFGAGSFLIHPPSLASSPPPCSLCESLAHLNASKTTQVTEE